MGVNPIAYRSLGFNFSEHLAKPLFFFAIIREHLGFRFKFGKKQDPVHDGRSANRYKGQFVSFQVSNWVGSCMAWPAMTMTIYWHMWKYDINMFIHVYSISVCDTSIWSHFSPFPKMEPMQIKTSLWHGHEWNWQMGVLKTLRILRNPDVEGILHFHFCKKGRILVASYSKPRKW